MCRYLYNIFPHCTGTRNDITHFQFMTFLSLSSIFSFASGIFLLITFGLFQIFLSFSFFFLDIIHLFANINYAIKYISSAIVVFASNRWWSQQKFHKLFTFHWNFFCLFVKKPVCLSSFGFLFSFKINFNRRQISHSVFSSQRINVLLVTSRVVDKVFFRSSLKTRNERA